MTVTELITALQDLEHPNAKVVLEGCDCIGKATGVDVLPSGEVLIERD